MTPELYTELLEPLGMLLITHDYDASHSSDAIESVVCFMLPFLLFLGQA